MPTDTERLATLKQLVNETGHLEFEQRDGGQVAYRAGLGADWSEPMTWERMMETLTTKGGDASCQEPS